MEAAEAPTATCVPLLPSATAVTSHLDKLILLATALSTVQSSLRCVGIL